MAKPRTGRAATAPSPIATNRVGLEDRRRLPRRIGILFAHVASNIGDLAINRGQIDLLRQAFPEAELRVVFFNADRSAWLGDARASFGDTPVRFTFFKSHSELALSYLSDPAKFLDDCELGDVDLIVLSAGEHLFQYEHGENVQNLFWRTLPALAAKAAGKRCVLMPSTLGPFEDPQSASLARSLLRLVDGYAVRDAESGPLLQATLALPELPPVLPDPAFFLSPPARPADDGVETVALVMRSETWGIRLAKSDKAKGEKDPAEASDAYRFAASFADEWLAEPGRRLQLFVQTDADAALAEALTARLEASGAGDRLSTHRPSSIEDYLARLAAVDAVVASRFHAIILGLVAGTPGWGTYFEAHGHKIPGLFALLGQPERCTRLSSAVAEEAGVAVARAVAAGDRDIAAVQRRLDALRADTLRWLIDVPTRIVDAPTLLEAMRAFGRFSAGIAQEGMKAATNRKILMSRAQAEATAAELQARIAALETAAVESRAAADAVAAALREREAQLHETSARTAADQAARFADRLEQAIADAARRESALRQQLDDAAAHLAAEGEKFRESEARQGQRLGELARELEEQQRSSEEARRRMQQELETAERRAGTLESELAAERHRAEAQRETQRAQFAELAARHEAVLGQLELARQEAHAQAQQQQRDAEALRTELAASRAGIERLDAALAASRGDTERLRADLAAARGELAATQADLATTRGDLAATQAELETTRGALATTHAELATARDDLAATQAELVSMRRALDGERAALDEARTGAARAAWSHAAELERLREQAAHAVWSERDKWTSLLAYRAGNVLVEGLRRPLHWPLLPFRLVGEWRDFRADRMRRLAAPASGDVAIDSAQARENAAEVAELLRPTVDAASAHAERKQVAPAPAPVAADAAGVAPAATDAPVVAAPVDDGASPSVASPDVAMPEAVDPLVDIFRERGIRGVLERIAEERGELPPKALAMELLKRGKALVESGERGIEMPLARAAMELDGSVGVLRGAFWAAQRAGEYATACDVIMRIESILGASASEAELRALAQLKSSPAYQLSSLKLIEERKPPVYEPVPRRICYVLHNSLPYSSGGYATRSHGVAGGLQAQGYEVVCITRPGFPFDIKEDLAPGDVELDTTIEGVRYLRIERPHSKGISVPNFVGQSADELTARFRELRPEMVIAASNYRIGLMAMIAARRLGIPFIYEVRGWWELTRMSRDTSFMDTPSFVVQSALERAVANQAEHVFTLTEPMRETLVEQGAAPAQVTLLPNSCDPDRFVPVARDDALARRLGIPDGVPVIGYVGTFVDYEGLEDLAEACSILAQRGQPFRLLLVGNENTSGQDRGPITSQILEVAEREGFSDWLIMPGRVPHDEVEHYYSLIDVAPFPRKPWPVCEMVSPMKPLEALAMEKAVVASDVRALAEMIRDGQTGLLFRKGDVTSLADVLQRLIVDPELRATLGRQGRRWVREERTWAGVGGLAAGVISRIVAADDR